jgi:hypothetical protein
MPRVTCQCGAELELGPDAPKAQKCGSCGAKVVPVTGGGPITDETRFTAALIIRRGPQNKGRVFLLGGDDPIEVGKRSSRHIALKGGLKVSRHHCTIINSGGTWVITDNESSHGVVVRSKKTEIHPLEDGDTIWIGEYKIRFKLLGEEGGTYDDDEGDGSSEMGGASNNEDEWAEDSSEMTTDLTEAATRAERDMDLMREPGAQNFKPAPFEPPPPANVEAPVLPIESEEEDDEDDDDVAPMPVADRGVGAQCPQCDGPMQSKAVLCTNCGFDLSRGKQVSEAETIKKKGDVLGEEPEGQLAVMPSGFGWGQLVVPVILLSFGLILHFIAGRLAINYREWTGSAGNVFGFIVVQALIGVTLSTLSCLIVATLMSISFGGLQMAALRMVAIVIMPAALQTGVSAVFHESPMVANIVSFCLLTACYVGLLVWMFDLTSIEALILAVVIGVINVWVVAMFIGDFSGWVVGGSAAPSVDPVAPVGVEGGGGT